MASEPSPRRRVRVDGPHAGRPTPAAKVQRQLKLDPITDQKLAGLAILTGRSVSDLVTEWANAHCKGLVFYLRSPGGQPPGQGQGQGAGGPDGPPPGDGAAP